ncbi:hypothetical protein DS745_05050 [Anaerobacillus alkaliphilus]|uniref:GH18 domain-containing protein n=1 Tax=Anaerobacillus alkaliphilus TaxID=1548597 RepID=A0A4Q0VX89_9BACI|nr:stalk domain-containing protein [Anaerobacillus alkaliphilus]RXJ02952.1 hypothetical protein DS745_05050 [Anaerobacillus alkaliphilus]
MLKKLLVIAILLGSIILPFDSASASSQDIKVYLDNFELKFDVQPRMVANRTLVPFRKLSESIGINVRWDGPNQTIYATGNGTDVKLVMNSRTAVVNGKNVTLDAAPFTDNSRTLIPLRFFMETFDAKVEWNQQSREIRVTSAQRDMYTMAFYALGSFERRQYIPKFDSVAYGWASIDRNGNFITARRDSAGNLIDYYWPVDHSLASTADLIYSGQSVGGEAFLMVAALDYNIINTLVHDASKTQRAINEMVSLAVARGLDGIMIDFEGIRNRADHDTTKRAFTAFIEKLSVEAKKNSLKLSVALVPPNNAFSGYEYGKIARVVDFVFLMAYDYHPRVVGDPFGHMRPEPLESIDAGIQLTLKEVPKEKLVLGVNLVHETNSSIPNVIGLAKRHNLKGVGFWLVRSLDDQKISVINRSVKLK